MINVYSIKESEEELSTLKVWSLDRYSFEKAPTCIKILQPDPRVYQPNVSNSSIPKITSVSYASNISLLAIGFSTGAIILYKGEYHYK